MSRPLNSLDPLFQPKSIAVIGASDTPGRIGGMPIAHLMRFGYAGPIYPINPKYDVVQGLTAFPAVGDVKAAIDMAIVAVPAAGAMDALRQSAEAGVKAVVLFTSGFAEVGPQGAAAQSEIADLAQRTGMRILGPNCLGVMSAASATYATFSPVISVGIAPLGHIGLVSQSGAFGGFSYALARERGLGLSHWATTGNEADIQLADCLDWLIEDDQTKVVLAYMEGCRDGDRFVRALQKARAAKKPVVIVKVGRTDLGAAAAASHTAALAGSDAVYDAVFRQFGVHRAATIEEAFDVAYAVSVAGLPRGRSIGMLTASGGAGVLMADAAAAAGLDAHPMPESAQKKILERVAFASARNPVDVTGQVSSDPELMPLAYRLMLEEGNYDSVVSFSSAAGLSPGGPALIKLAADMRARYPDRVIALCTLFPPELHRTLDEAGLISFEDPSRAVRAVAALASFAANAASSSPPSPKADLLDSLPSGALSEIVAMRTLAAAAIPMAPHRLVSNEDDAAAAAAALGYPVVAKIVSPDILHKTEINGVALNLADDDALRAAVRRLLADVPAAKPGAGIDGVMIAPMIRRGVECILGVQKDPVFGPVVMFGLGGVLVEALRDVSFRLAPFDVAEARRMVDEIKARPVLDGWRGSPPTDVDALCEALAALSRFAAAAGDQLESVDLNPFVVMPKGEGAMALDAVLITAG